MTVTTLGINSSQDLYLGFDGNIVVKSGITAVEDICTGVGLTQLQECVYQQGNGQPNFQAIWIGTPQYLVWENSLRTNLQAVNGVNEVSDLVVQPQNGELDYQATIETEYGQTTVKSPGFTAVT